MCFDAWSLLLMDLGIQWKTELTRGERIRLLDVTIGDGS